MKTRIRLIVCNSIAFLFPFSVLISPLRAQQRTWYGETGLTLAYMTPNNFNMLDYAAWAVGFEQTAWFAPRPRLQDSSLITNHSSLITDHHYQLGLKASYALVPQSLSGHRLGFAGMLRAPLWSRVDYQLGLGLSYYTRSRHFTRDPENIFISTVFSCLIDVGLVLHLGDGAVATLALVHTSNGMTHRPNKGLNYLQLGLAAPLTTPPLAPHSPELITHNSKLITGNELGLALQLGLVASRDGRIAASRLFPCYDLSLSAQHYLSPVLAVGGTLDLWYNFAHREVILMDGLDYRLPFYGGALAHVEGFWGPVSVKAGIGLSLGGEMVTIPVYERVGAYYNFGPHYLGVALNAHAGVIEFVEWAYGFRLPLGRRSQSTNF